MQKKQPKLTCEQLEDRCTPSISIQFDYSRDTNGFINDSARRTALENAALMVTARLDDTLAAITPSGTNTWKPSIIHPGTGAKVTLSGKTKVPANTIIIFAGGRNLADGTLGIGGRSSVSSSGTTAWLNRVKGRGEPGALLAKPTDTAPAIGHITFDTVGTNWHFGATTSGLDSNESDFMSVAMHEVTHVLGINNSSSNSWSQLISGNFFTGKKTRAANGGTNVRVHSGKGHFAEGVKNSNGVEAAMDPTLTRGTRKFLGALDFAALDDIGWDIRTSDGSIFRAKDKIAKPERDSGGLVTGDSVLFNGRIESSKDVDIYRIFADATINLSVSVSAVSGGQNVDTYVRLYDGAGNSLKTADQGGTGGTDSLSYKINRKDYYYIAVSSYANRAYDPLSFESGPGGPLGDYRMVITLE